MGKPRKPFLRAERKKFDTQFIPTYAKNNFVGENCTLNKSSLSRMRKVFKLGLTRIK